MKSFAWFESWLKGLTADEFNLYLILNPLSNANLLSHAYFMGWVEKARPLYAQTAMESLTQIGPWLLQPKPSSYVELAKWCSDKSDSSWGWAYTSLHTWQQQLVHWQSLLRVSIDGELRVIRFQDPRVLNIWLEQGEPELWSQLLRPVAALRLASGTEYIAPEVKLVESARPWVMPLVLSDGWHHSDFGLKVKASNLEMLLWENYPARAEQLYQEHGSVEQPLYHWLHSQVEKGKVTRHLGLEQVIDWLTSPILKGSDV